MIWVLIVVTLAGDVAFQPFATKQDCEVAQKKVTKPGDSLSNASVVDSVCLRVENPYRH